jgi:hypothetical protein
MALLDQLGSETKEALLKERDLWLMVRGIKFEVGFLYLNRHRQEQFSSANSPQVHRSNGSNERSLAAAKPRSSLEQRREHCV